MCIILIMDFELFRREIKGEIFDSLLLSQYLLTYKKPRDKIASLISKGKIIRLKNGIYIFGENWRNSPLCLETIANVLYGPSCISFEYALNRYSMIADRAVTITSLVIGDSKSFHTPIGTFEYRAINPKKFKVGIQYESLEDGSGYFIASKEKALADLVYKTPRIRSLRQLRYWLFKEMRMEEQSIEKLDRDLLTSLGTAYNKKSVRLLREL